MHRDPYPVTHHVAHDAKAIGFDVLLDGSGDVSDTIAGDRLRDAHIQGLTRHAEQLVRGRRDRS